MSTQKHLKSSAEASPKTMDRDFVPGPEVSVRFDFDGLMQAHLTRVFNERDSSRRQNALVELYAEDATLFEPHGAATGREAISAAVDALQVSLPPSFVFTAAGAAVGHHGVARLHWRAGPPTGPPVVTGTDVAHVADGRIRALHVFLDPAPL
jgi:ketosteroid isomerase-like protein